jgi:hypothetical protein
LFNECSLFLVLRLAFIFRLDFCSDLVISLYQGVFRPLVYVGFHLKRVVIKRLNGVGKEKRFHLRLAFVFRLDFCSELVISLYQGVFRPLVYVGFHLKRFVIKRLNGVGKEKRFHAYSRRNGSLFRLWLRLLHVMLDVILIVCLVVFAVA